MLIHEKSQEQLERLLAITWVKYLCYFEAFLKLASSRAIFFKNIVI